jgi:hypothetical protein
MSSVYERELKGILSGEEDMLRKMTKATPPEVTSRYLKARQRPLLVVRGAGSLGVVLGALPGDVSFAIEVKSASSDTISFSDTGGRNGEQAETMMKECSRAFVIPLYAFRLKGGRGADPWRVMTLPTENLPPRIGVLYDRLPKVEKTTAGNWVLRWENGMPLSQFVDYLCS